MPDLRTTALHLGTALLAGSAIGLERTYSGRPAGFRLVESRVPTTRYASFTVQFDRGAAWPESRLLEVLAETGLDHSDPSYRTSDHGRIFASGVTLRTNRAGAFARLAQRLSTVPEVRSFDIAPYREAGSPPSPPRTGPRHSHRTPSSRCRNSTRLAMAIPDEATMPRT